MLKTPLVVCITGASGQMCYSLLPHICSGQTWGPDQPVILHLLDVNVLAVHEALRAVEMELEDSIHPLLRTVMFSSDASKAVKDADVVIAMHAAMQTEGVEKKDVIEQNCTIFSALGQVIESVAKPTCKVLVVGDYANTNCLILSKSSPNLPRSQISGLSRLEHNRALAQIAAKADAPVESVYNCFVWGNRSSTLHVDTTQGKVAGKSVKEVVDDDAWMTDKLVSVLLQRGAQVITSRPESPGLSLAQAISDHLHDWMMGTPPGRYVSMIVDSSNNAYGIAEGLFYSFPCSCNGGIWNVIEGHSTDDATREKLRISENELLDEMTIALEALKSINSK